jgi:hypothetical protein
MKIVLWLMSVQAVIGAFDTLYYHEWRAHLPARGKAAAAELRLHAARDFFYAVLFATLPYFAWQGGWAVVLAAVIVAEIILTLWDFVVEIAVRRDLGDVYAGERVTHSIMGIIYGAMVGYLIPSIRLWLSAPKGMIFHPAPVSFQLRWLLLVMAAGVFMSGARDLYAALGLPGGNWPWPPQPGARFSIPRVSIATERP